MASLATVLLSYTANAIPTDSGGASVLGNEAIAVRAIGTQRSGPIVSNGAEAILDTVHFAEACKGCDTVGEGARDCRKSTLRRRSSRDVGLLLFTIEMGHLLGAVPGARDGALGGKCFKGRNIAR